MSSCQGELPGKTFAVSAVDSKGHELINGNVTTLKNGFLELWLPRDRSIQLTITGMGREAEGRIGTYRGSDTCLTTFQLK
jgi:hypothetical protein